MSRQQNELAQPYLSVVIPMYNRAALIRRAIDSCLRASFLNYEIIVVDDGSTDASASVVSQINHPAVRLIQHNVNRGLSCTRNTGIEHATGEWVILLDSDDEFVEGALDLIRQRAMEVPSDIAVLWFQCRMDDGTLTPFPSPQAGRWDYEHWLSFCESMTVADANSEMLLAMRRSAHHTFRFPDERVPEDRTYFDLAKCYGSWFYPVVLRLYHQDANDQMTKQSQPGGQIHRDRRSTVAETEEWQRLIDDHGSSLAAHAPRTYVMYQTRLAASAFRCGRTSQGVKACLKALARRPLHPRTIGLLVFGLLGPNVLERVRASRLPRLGTEAK
jgi:glycosyltransferase involved in cell wall biosynthesis